MPKTAVLRNPGMFDSFELYTRAIYDENHIELVRRIGREPRVIYPRGWYDYDVDRVVLGKYCVRFGKQEWKQIDTDAKGYRFTDTARLVASSLLETDHMKIEDITLNDTPHNRIGVKSKTGIDVLPISRDNYDNLLRSKRRILDQNPTQRGKGVFLHILYTPRLEYFSVINFTGSKYVLGNKVLREAHRRYWDRVLLYLRETSPIIEPCFNEILLFMLEAYVRWDFYTLHDYLTKRVNSTVLRLEDEEMVLSKGFIEMGNIVSLWLAFQDVMEWLLECIHFDTILEDAVSIKSISRNRRRVSYNSLARLVQEGRIFNYLAERIRERYGYYEGNRRKAS